MDQILILIPGFFGLAIYKMFSGDTKSEPLSSSIMSYVIYSSFSWFFTYLVYLLSLNQYVFNIIGIIHNPFYEVKEITVKEYLIAIISAVILGWLWFYKFQFWSVKLINILNDKINRRHVNLNTNIISAGLRKEKSHYIQISKEGKTICSGALLTEDIANGKVILSIDPTKNFDSNDNQVDESKIKSIIAYVDLKNGTIIKDIIFQKEN